MLIFFCSIHFLSLVVLGLYLLVGFCGEGVGFLGMSMVGKKHVKSQIKLLISSNTDSLPVINEVMRKK